MLVVGSVERELVSKHRRTRNFTAEHYDSLARALWTVQSVSVTPNTLTEVSNLLENAKDTRFLDRLRELIECGEEVMVESKVAARHHKFPKIGLTDAVLLEVVSPRRPLLTTDHDLHGLAAAKGDGVSFNFWHYQDF